jgi:D-tagatose-1,6-bisphosphate aldolase subunit GatZ/KbaZ
MYLDDIVSAQKRGEARGIASICSAHPVVLEAAIKTAGPGSPALIEATCNQVNQFGGYTGMRPADFVKFVRGIAEKSHVPFENIILGGDHLGPSAWQEEPAEVAMGKAETLIRDYIRAGFVKIHLDCSMRLGDDPEGALNLEVSAGRAARLAKIAENFAESLESSHNLRYVIGTEVPIPGGAREHEEGVSVTKVEDARQTIEVTREAFLYAGLEAAWERVTAVVVQPGVEFGDDFVLPYRPEATRELSKFIESQPMIYEAHSTDYQTRQALRELVRDHFAILKVGPALTFTFRDAVYALAEVENELFGPDKRSNLISVLDEVMVGHPAYWIKYYHGSEEEQAYKRKYSLSDRIRYYWAYPVVQQTFQKMVWNLERSPLPLELLKQSVPGIYIPTGIAGSFTLKEFLFAGIQNVLDDYAQACNPH